MSRDNSFSYIHFGNHNQAQYMEDWKDYDIPYNEIDTARLFDETCKMFPQLLLDEDDAIPLSSAAFGAKAHKNKHLRRQIWTDLNIDAIQTRRPDASILAPLHSVGADTALADFLANGHADPSDPDADVSDELWSHDLSANHTFNYKSRARSSYSMPSHPSQTPRIGKSRQPSLEKFQSPITRTMR